MIENVCFKISNKIGKETNKTGEEIKVINYGLFILIHTAAGILITTVIGMLIGKLNEMILITLISSSLKRYSGGVHATSSNRCLIIGAIMTIICTYISKLFFYINMPMVIFINSVICYYIFYKNCPVGTKHKPLKNEKKRKILRKKMFFILNTYKIFEFIIIILVYNNFVSFRYIEVVYCIELGILLQTFALTNIGEKIILKIDCFLTI